MKTKKVFLLVLCCILLLVLLNVLLIKNYQNYVYDTISGIANNLVNKYPDDEDIIMDAIINGKSKKDVLVKYGINKETINELSSFKEMRNKTIVISVGVFVLLLLIILFIYLRHVRKIKKEFRDINSYLQDILKGTYDLNIASYSEDELAILKNDIYKVAIKLKELSEYEKKEQVYLSNTLEDISHQLKTPLTALMLINDILKNNDLTDSEKTEFLSKCTKELEKMEWLITTLLKYSKLESGAVRLKHEEVNVKELIEDIISSLSIVLELKNIQVNLENLDFKIVCDINWTKEAFINIIKNAYEHLDSKGVITIKGNNNPLCREVSITDNGAGIPKKEIKNIFKRFYSMNTAKNSVGIGLNLAKLIIEKQKGKIEVSSEVGKYTTFNIIFPKRNF